MAMAAPLPMIIPMRKVPMAAPRRSLGKESVSMDNAAGANAASPMPTAARAAKSCVKLVA
jgi:hypothetical protein